MGNKKEHYLIPLFVLLAVAAFWAYRPGVAKEVIKPQLLDQALAGVGGSGPYRFARTLPLDEPTINFLDLDDYTQMVFEHAGVPVNLFIGYYYSLEKISAAHSPLVCFPGQGWTITAPTEHHLAVGEHRIHYAETIASLGEHQELVLFWYQADKNTIPQAYRNKLHAMYNKLTNGREEHAFVRVTVPVLESGLDQARSTAEQFITVFYPRFLEYVNNEPLPLP
jgi:EpsI family protein